MNETASMHQPVISLNN